MYNYTDYILTSHTQPKTGKLQQVCRHLAASLLSCQTAISGCVHMACHSLSMKSLSQVVNRLVASWLLKLVIHRLGACCNTSDFNWLVVTWWNCQVSVKLVKLTFCNKSVVFLSVYWFRSSPSPPPSPHPPPKIRPWTSTGTYVLFEFFLCFSSLWMISVCIELLAGVVLVRFMDAGKLTQGKCMLNNILTIS